MLNTEGNNILDSPASNKAQWDVRPFQIVSLDEMIEFWAFFFHEVIKKLEQYRRQVGSKIAQGGTFLLSDDEKECEALLSSIKFMCEPFDMERTLRRVGLPLPHNFEKLQWTLDELDLAIHEDLLKITFMFVPANKAIFHSEYRTNRNDVLQAIFDEGAKNAKTLPSIRFPSAAHEIKEASNCYAVGANTACVMHSMRALEVGLKSVVRKLKVTPKNQNWDTILREIQPAIQLLGKAERDFYSEIAIHFRHLKDAWRNHAMHASQVYDEWQALSIMTHVKELMQHLAIKLKE